MLTIYLLYFAEVFGTFLTFVCVVEISVFLISSLYYFFIYFTELPTVLYHVWFTFFTVLVLLWKHFNFKRIWKFRIPFYLSFFTYLFWKLLFRLCWISRYCYFTWVVSGIDSVLSILSVLELFPQPANCENLLEHSTNCIVRWKLVTQESILITLRNIATCLFIIPIGFI